MPQSDREKRQRYNREYFASHKKLTEGASLLKTEKKAVLTIRIPVMLLGRLQAIVNQANADGRFPWRTMTAAVIALITGGLENMKEDPFIAEQLEQLHVMEGAKKFAQLRTEAQATLSIMRTEINELLSIKADHHALTAYCNFRDDIEDMSPTVWRDWLLGSLKKAYPRLERGSESVDVSFKVRPKVDRRSHADRRRDEAKARAIAAKTAKRTKIPAHDKHRPRATSHDRPRRRPHARRVRHPRRKH